MTESRILHCADLHLDHSFASSGLQSDAGTWRRADLRATLGHILTLARARKVDVVTIAGDLYEQDYTLPDTAEFLAQQFSKLAPIRVFVSPGECDPYTNDSLYAITRWPENVTIFSQGKLSRAELAPSIFLWGAACPPARGYQTLENLQTDRDGVNLLLLHAAGGESPRSGHESVFSVDVAAVRAAGFDFALLGHRHSGQLLPEDAPCCIYPGSPEPLAPKEEDGVHRVVLLSIKGGVCTPELIPISQWQHRSLTVDLTDCASTGEAASRVVQALQALQETDPERLICTVTLTGTPEFLFDIKALAGKVETKAHIRYEGRLSPAHDLEQLAQEQTVRGLLVRRFQENLASVTDEQERRRLLSVLSLALQALDGKRVRPYEID
jgi:DNA repair exonuclease SbcCD nuclease subunit